MQSISQRDRDLEEAELTEESEARQAEAAATADAIKVLECRNMEDLERSTWTVTGSKPLADPHQLDVTGKPEPENGGFWITYHFHDSVADRRTPKRRWIPAHRVLSIEPLELSTKAGF